MSGLPLDHIALAGYTILFVFAAYKISDTVSRPVDFFGTVLLLTGLGALMSYHYTLITTGKDETHDAGQKMTRQIAHATITAFFLTTLLPESESVFQAYDAFALTAHAFLLYAVTAGVTQLPGVMFLFIYFVMASYRSATKTSVDLVQMMGRLLLAVYFGVNSYTGAIAMH
jgi:hypothetical protein